MAGRGRPFQKGQSGNPTGKARGTRSHAMQALEKILDGDAESILRRAIELAQEGDGTALRLCLDRAMPAKKDRPVQFDLPTLETAADLPKATNALLQAVASGELTPSEAADIGRSLDVHVRAIEAADLHQRLLRIEEQTNR